MSSLWWALVAPVWAGAGVVGNVPGDFATIQQAVTEGTAPVIRVAPGRWSGAVVDRSVRIEGDGAEIVAGVEAGALLAGFRLVEGADDAEISGFVFACDGPALDAGVYTAAASDGRAPAGVVVSENTFRSCAQGVTVIGPAAPDRCASEPRTASGAWWSVQHNRFEGFATRSDAGRSGGGLGIYLFNVRSADVVDNLFTGAGDASVGFSAAGVALAGCADCAVAGNRFASRGATGSDWAAVVNLGARRPGAAQSSRVRVVDNHAGADRAPRGLHFLSYASADVAMERNDGVGLIDHDGCGDGMLLLVEPD